MKIIGIILIILQVVAIMGGGVPAGNLPFLLGFFAPGIIGVILLIKSASKQEKKDEDQ